MHEHRSAYCTVVNMLYTFQTLISGESKEIPFHWIIAGKIISQMNMNERKTAHRLTGQFLFSFFYFATKSYWICCHVDDFHHQSPFTISIVSIAILYHYHMMLRKLWICACACILCTVCVCTAKESSFTVKTTEFKRVKISIYTNIVTSPCWIQNKISVILLALTEK